MTVGSSTFFDRARVIDAVTSSRNQADAIRKLGHIAHAANFGRLRSACTRYGLAVPGRNGDRDNSHLPPVHVAFADEAKVREVLTSSVNAVRAAKALGLPAGGRNTAAVRAEAVRLGIEMVEIPEQRGYPKNRAPVRRMRHLAAENMGKEALAAKLADSRSQREFLVSIGVGWQAADYVWLRNFLPSIGLDVPEKLDRRGMIGMRDSEFFVLGKRRGTSEMKKKIIAGSLIPHANCALCDMTAVWNGQVLVLQLDHINGETSDNRLSNLRFLCPNCHSQTDTFNKPKHLRKAVTLAA